MSVDDVISKERRIILPIEDEKNDPWITVIWKDSSGGRMVRQIRASQFMTNPQAYGYPGCIVLEGKCREVVVKVNSYRLEPK